MVLIPVSMKCIEMVLTTLAAAGLGLGLLSLIAPARSIELYQGLMRMFNWRVDPLDWKKELRNTRVLGGLLAMISVILLAALFCPKFPQLL